MDENNNVITLGEEMDANKISAEDLSRMYQGKKDTLKNISIKATDAKIRSAMINDCEGNWHRMK